MGAGAPAAPHTRMPDFGDCVPGRQAARTDCKLAQRSGDDDAKDSQKNFLPHYVALDYGTLRIEQHGLLTVDPLGAPHKRASSRCGGPRHGVRVAQAALRHVRERRGQPHAAAAARPPRVDEREDGRRRQQRHHWQVQPRRQRHVAALEEHVAQHDVRAKGLPSLARQAVGARLSARQGAAARR